MNCVESRRRGRLLGLRVARLGLGGRMEGGGGGEGGGGSENCPGSITLKLIMTIK